MSFLGEGKLSLSDPETFLGGVSAGGSTGALYPVVPQETVQPQGNIFTRALTGLQRFVESAVIAAPSLANSIAILRGKEPAQRTEGERIGKDHEYYRDAETIRGTLR